MLVVFSGFFYWTSIGREKKPSKMKLLLLSCSSECKFVVSKQALLELVQQALLGLVQQALFGLVQQALLGLVYQ